jgi:signal transduction histidine kinase
LDDVDLAAALRELGRRVASRFGVNVDCQAIGLDEGARLPNEIEVALYRIAQEALTNAVRHGHAHAVQILLQRRNGNILTVIEDDGLGFDARRPDGSGSDGGHLGLLGIEERVALLGGRFRVESRPGAGAGIFVEIPVEDQSCLGFAC